MNISSFSHYQKATLFGVLGMGIGFIAFLYNYYMVPSTLFGYEVIAAPAMFALSFFSEETYFIPKMVIFLFGQFLGYFFVVLIVMLVHKYQKRFLKS